MQSEAVVITLEMKKNPERMHQADITASVRCGAIGSNPESVVMYQGDNLNEALEAITEKAWTESLA